MPVCLVRGFIGALISNRKSLAFFNNDSCDLCQFGSTPKKQTVTDTCPHIHLDLCHRKRAEEERIGEAPRTCQLHEKDW
jgi:hypothetical protein